MLIGKKFGKKIAIIKNTEKTAFIMKLSIKAVLNSYLLNISFNAFAGKNLTF